jgi:hypothetical protein
MTVNSLCSVVDDGMRMEWEDFEMSEDFGGDYLVCLFI